MKRTKLKSKTGFKPSSRTLRKKSKQSISKIQRDIWVVLRLRVFEMYGTDCYTCPAKNLKGVNLQCGHLWAKASLGAYLKYDTRLLRPQCMRCNIHHGGQGAVFYARLLREIGPVAMEQLENDRSITVKAKDHYTTLLLALTKVWK